MSHFAEVAITALVKNEKDLIAALKAFFGDDAVEVHAEAQALTGYDMRANKKAHIIVRKEDVAKKNKQRHAYNDLGFERMKTGTYTLHVDNMDVAVSEKNRIVQDYAERVATRQLKAKGYTMKRQTLKDGTVKLVATKFE